MGIILIIFFFIFLRLFFKKNNFKNTFYIFSLIFLVFFFIIPFYIYLNSYSIEYVGKNIQKNQYLTLKIIISLVVFILGFILIDFIKILNYSNKKDKSNIVTTIKLVNYKKSKKMLNFLTLLVSLYYIVLLTKSNRSIDFYEVKQTREGGSWLILFLTLTTSAIKYGIVFSWIYLDKYKIALYSFTFMFIIEIMGGIGRTDLLLGFLILITLITKIKSINIAYISFALIFFLLPILINLKLIIYGFIINNEMPDLTKYYIENLNFADYLNNFGHPFVSLLISDDLVNQIDYRYFYDYIQGILFYGKVIGLDFGNSLTYYNTKVILGYESSIIPTGYLSFGYLQLDYIGVFIAGLTYRYSGIIAEKFYNKLNFESDIIKIFFAFIAANTFYHGDIRILVMTFILPLFLIILFMKKVLKF
jgi:hypothetical protein